MVRSDVGWGLDGKRHHAPSLDCCIPTHASRGAGKPEAVHCGFTARSLGSLWKLRCTPRASGSRSALKIIRPEHRNCGQVLASRHEASTSLHEAVLRCVWGLFWPRAVMTRGIWRHMVWLGSIEPPHSTAQIKTGTTLHRDWPSLSFEGRASCRPDPNSECRAHGKPECRARCSPQPPVSQDLRFSEASSRQAKAFSTAETETSQSVDQQRP